MGKAWGSQRGWRRPRFALLGILLAFGVGAQRTTAAEFARARLATDAQRIATALDGSDDTTRGLVRALAGGWGEQRFLDLLANVSSALDSAQLADRQWALAAELAARRGDTAALLTALNGNIQAALGLGDYARCTQLAGRLRALARAAGDPIAEAAADNALGIVARRRGNLDEALAYQRHALELNRAAGNSAGAAAVLSDLGTIQRDRGDFASALDAQLDAASERERSGGKLEMAYRNIALLYREIGDADAARDYFRRALAAAAARGAPSAYATVIGAYASFLNDIGEFGDARTAAAEALAIDTALGDRPHQGLEHLEIGRAWLGLHDIDSALPHLQEALRLGREVEQRETVARALLHLAEAALAQREPVRARGLVDEAVVGLEIAQLRPQLAQAYALREQLARVEHDDAAALRYAHKFAAAREELLGIRASRQVAALEARHARAQTEQRLVLLGKDNELQAALLERQTLRWRLYVGAAAGLLALLLLLAWRYVGVSRLNRALELRNAEVERQRAELSDANVLLEKQAADLYEAATTDWLTATANRRHLLEQLEERIADSRYNARELALMIIDFDHFKQINDRRGHPFGDRALAIGAGAMRECLGPNDLLGRFGGEEFVAVACDRDPAAMMALAERIRERVAEQLGALAPELRSIATISIGVARLAELQPTQGSDALLEAADRALYAAKSAGRNRVARYAA